MANKGEKDMDTGRAEMAGCKKHYRIRSGGDYVDVTPDFFETHLNGILAIIQPTLCDLVFYQFKQLMGAATQWFLSLL